MTEIWRPVVGFEGSYEVSNLGRVRSLDRIVVRSDGVSRFYSGVVRRLQHDQKGYLQVSLQDVDKRRLVRVHTLVAEAFIGPRLPGCEVLHNKDDKSDNRSESLRYGTPSENVAEKVANARTVRGEQCHFHKLTEQEVVTVRRLAGRISQREIASEFGLTQQGISDIVRRKCWRHV